MMTTPRPGTEVEEIRLELPSRLEFLSIIDKVIDGIADQMSFEEDDKDAIAISVVEAGTNAIQHGHVHESMKKLVIVFRLSRDSLEIDVADHGPGFDLDIVEDATAPENLLKPRGRGIFIMKSMMDDVSFEFTETGTICRLVKHRRSGHAIDPIGVDAGLDDPS